MPFYEFRCPDCMITFDLRRVIDQRDLPAQCPQCEGMYSSRLISAPMSIAIAVDGGGMRTVTSSSGCGGCSATSCGTCPSG